jgi:hypothetical protein
MNHKSFLLRLPSSRKDRLFEWNEYVCYKIVAAHFGVIWEFVDNIEAARVLYDREHEFFALDITFRLCDHVISW